MGRVLRKGLRPSGHDPLDPGRGVRGINTGIQMNESIFFVGGLVRLIHSHTGQVFSFM